MGFDIPQLPSRRYVWQWWCLPRGARGGRTRGCGDVPKAGESSLQRCCCVDLLLQQLCHFETQQRCLAERLSHTQKTGRSFTPPSTRPLKPPRAGEVQDWQFWGAAGASFRLQHSNREGGKWPLLPKVGLAVSFHSL